MMSSRPALRLAGLVVYSWVQDDGGPVHRTAGYVAAGVVATRLLWATLAKGHGSLAALRPPPPRHSPRGIGVMSWWWRENLSATMLTGRRRV